MRRPFSARTASGRHDHPAAGRWELITCGLKGHVLAGVGAETIGAEHAPVVLEAGGLRWHRCLRCDGWRPSPVPSEPTGVAMPDPDRIVVPVRGRALRDRWVLRLIALDRLLHGIVLVSAAVLLWYVAGHRAELSSMYDRVVTALEGGTGVPAGSGGLAAPLRRLFTVSPSHLRVTAAAAAGYALLEAVEMVGLWRARRWAEYLTFAATVVLLPLEVYELVGGFSVLKAATFVLNVAVAAYLLWSKRLFGLRGGAHAEAEPTGWEALAATAPAAASGA